MGQVPDEVPPLDWAGFLNGPRFSGVALPDDVECDCVCTGIDAAREAVGFGAWMAATGLVDVACRADPAWRRPGVAP